jgi:cobalt-zinc-cadmium efflux system membrane fusion protein
MTKLSLKYLPLLLFALITVSSCKDKKDGNTESKEVPEQTTTDTAANGVKTITFTDDQFKLSDIQTGAIESRNLSSVIKMTGIIDAEPGSVVVSAPLGGYIKTSGLCQGNK